MYYRVVGRLSAFRALWMALVWLFIQSPLHSQDSLFPCDSVFQLVKDYARSMMEKGRDRYGDIHSPLFASALDRETLNIRGKAAFDSITGVRGQDRSIGGSDIMEDQGLLHVLFELTAITGDRTYRNEAEKALGFFLSNCQSRETGLFAWGEHLFWDFEKERMNFSSENDEHEADVWDFWDLCYHLNPEACMEFAFGEWNHQVFDKQTGDFSRHAAYIVHGPKKNGDFPRYAGQMISRWARMYKLHFQATGKREDELIKAISVILKRMEDNMGSNPVHILPASHVADYVWLNSNLELARCLHEARTDLDTIGGVEADLLARMDNMALAQDRLFLKMNETFDGTEYKATIDLKTLKPRSRSTNLPYSRSWETGYGYFTHAFFANLCLARSAQLEDFHPDLASKYLDMAGQTAGFYLHNAPDTALCLMPSVFAQIMDMFLSLYRISGNKDYIRGAELYAEESVLLFFNYGIALPKASTKHKHYEAITGGPELMYALLKVAKLHLDEK